MSLATEPEREGEVGYFSVDVELASFSDELLQRVLPDHEVRTATARGLADSGAVMVHLPERLALELGLPDSGELASVVLADGSEVTRRVVRGLRLSWRASDGEVRSEVFSAVAEPNQDTLLIGAIVLEVLDLLPDCQHRQLVPRHPGRITFPVGIARP
jgi:hypothetical protein